MLLKEKDFEQVTVENLDTFMDVARRTPTRVILAYSKQELCTGVPLTEIYRPPYGVGYLALGVVLIGSSLVSGESQWFTIGQELNAIARTVGRQDDGKHWVPVLKDGRPLKIFMPK